MYIYVLVRVDRLYVEDMYNDLLLYYNKLTSTMTDILFNLSS